MNLKFTRINYFQVNNEQWSKWRAGRRGDCSGPQDKSVLYLHKNRLPSHFWEGSEVTIVIELSNPSLRQDKSLLANPRIYKPRQKLKMKGR